MAGDNYAFDGQFKSTSRQIISGGQTGVTSSFKSPTSTTWLVHSLKAMPMLRAGRIIHGTVTIPYPSWQGVRHY